MQKNSITNKITPCCGLPFSVIYWWVSNLTLNSEADRSFVLSQINQNGTIRIDGWKVLINSGTLEADASLTKAEFLAWFGCERQPSCEQLKIIIEGYKMGNWVGDLNEIRFENVLGSLKITDTAPKTQGLYILSDIGTYTNLGGLVTTTGKLNYAYFDGTTWSLIAVDIDVEEKIPDDFFVFEQQKTGEKLWIYNHSSFRGWFSKQNRNVSSIKKIRLYKRGNAFATTGNFTIKVWQTDGLGVGTEIYSQDFSKNLLTNIANGQFVDFVLNENVIINKEFIGISIEGDEMPPIMQSTDIVGNGYYKIQGNNNWIPDSDATHYGLYWEIFSSEKINNNYISSEKNELLVLAKNLANFPTENPIKTKILRQDSDIYLTLYGDSITAWQSTMVKAEEGVTEVPPVCERKGFANRLWNSLKFGNPIYRRFDYGKKSLVAYWENKWTDDSQAFFNESGNFYTFQYGGNQIPTNIYSQPQFTTEIASGGFPHNFDSATTFRDIPKRCASDANASVSFKIPAGYLKADFIFHSLNEGDDVTISVTGGNGKLLYHSKQNDWANAIEANGKIVSTARPIFAGSNDPSGIPCRRIFFKKVNISDEITVTITKSNNTSKWFCYWGASYWGTASLPYALHLTTMGRGGRRFNELNNTKSSDILGVNTDICVMENTLINSMGDRNAMIDFRAQFDIFKTFFNTNNIPVLFVSPHMTTINASEANFENSKLFHNGVRGYEIDNGAIVYDVMGLILNVWKTYYSEKSLPDFLAQLMYDGTTHPNEKGFDFYEIMSENILN